MWNRKTIKIPEKSEELAEFLETQGIHQGNKMTNGSMLPSWVFKKSRWRKAAIRGLFDTDGCVYNHTYVVNGFAYQYPKLAFTAYVRKIRQQFFDLLTLEGFSPKEYGMRVHLYLQKATLKYYDEIGTRNPWHEKRLFHFCLDYAMAS